MKKNITINLCGRLYQIDEDAYELLSQYIDALRNYFKKQDGGEEIANDIEERVAELFDDLKSQGVEAITIEQVQDIIHQIGQVEEIAGEGSEEAEEQSGAGTSQQSATRKTSCWQVCCRAVRITMAVVLTVGVGASWFCACFGFAW